MAYWGFFYSFKMSSLRLIVLILHFQAVLLNEGYVSVILSEMLHLQEYNSFIHKTQLSWLYFLNYFPLRLYRLCSIIFWYFVFWNKSLREAWFCFFAENLLFFFCFLAIMLEPLVLFVTQLFALDGRVFLSFVFFFFSSGTWWILLNSALVLRKIFLSYIWIICSVLPSEIICMCEMSTACPPPLYFLLCAPGKLPKSVSHCTDGALHHFTSALYWLLCGC